MQGWWTHIIGEPYLFRNELPCKDLSHIWHSPLFLICLIFNHSLVHTYWCRNPFKCFWTKCKVRDQIGSTLLLLPVSIFHSCWSRCWIFSHVIIHSWILFARNKSCSYMLIFMMSNLRSHSIFKVWNSIPWTAWTRWECIWSPLLCGLSDAWCSVACETCLIYGIQCKHFALFQWVDRCL